MALTKAEQPRNDTALPCPVASVLVPADHRTSTGRTSQGYQRQTKPHSHVLASDRWLSDSDDRESPAFPNPSPIAAWGMLPCNKHCISPTPEAWRHTPSHSR